MKSKQMNQRLVNNFPELEAKYFEEVNWQEGDETGSHVVYGDVFAPYIEQMVIQQNNMELLKIFDFIENILAENDEYFEEVIMFSVLERLMSDKEIFNKCKLYFGKRTEEQSKKIAKGYTQ